MDLKALLCVIASLLFCTSGRWRKLSPEKGDENIREIIEGTYRIIYRIKSDTHIEILMEHHSARDLTRREL
ncbi:MAG: hypothetical protein JJ895_14095 [Balneolaceae bacterium]|nr:hypothetical protein [Balneolaceae bacterium]